MEERDGYSTLTTWTDWRWPRTHPSGCAYAVYLESYTEKGGAITNVGSSTQGNGCEYTVINLSLLYGWWI